MARPSSPRKALLGRRFYQPPRPRAGEGLIPRRIGFYLPGIKGEGGLKSSSRTRARLFFRPERDLNQYREKQLYDFWQHLTAIFLATSLYPSTQKPPRDDCNRKPSNFTLKPSSSPEMPDEPKKLGFSILSSHPREVCYWNGNSPRPLAGEGLIPRQSGFYLPGIKGEGE